MPTTSRPTSRVKRPSLVHTFGSAALACVAIALAGAARPAVAAGASSAARPNILLIFVDDLGYADLGCQGSADCHTPHIDTIAASGLRCASAYVTAPQCGPSRAGLVTGRYPQRFGHEANPDPKFVPTFGLPTSQRTIADWLKPLGYETCAIGKWDLGGGAAYRPAARGFDEFFGFYTGSRTFLVDNDLSDYAQLRRGDERAIQTEYMTDELTRAAVEFISEERERPYFLYLAYNAPHWPMEAKEEDLKHFAHVGDAHRRTFLAMMRALDEGVGRVLSAARDAGADDTLVIFTSDNGGPTGAPRASFDAEFQFGRNTSLNTPLRGEKGDLFEGGIRVPFLIQWPERLPAGAAFEEPISTLDLLPTFLAAAGANESAAAEGNLDGVNLLPSLANESPLPERPLFWRFIAAGHAMRAGDWKLVRPRGAAAMLFNLADDVGETRDLAAERHEVVARMTAQLDRWDAELEPPLWRDPERPRNRGGAKSRGPKRAKAVR